MGGSSSKDKPVSTTDNAGVLNGNIINNGNIIEQIEKDVSQEALLLKIVIVLKAIHLLIIVIKWALKTVKNRENRNRTIDQFILENNRNP